MADLLNDLISSAGISLDLSTIISSSVAEMEKPFQGGSLYKFYGESLLPILENPTIRFTQRTQLNDPFELTMRWNEFMSHSTSSTIKDYVRNSLMYALSNDDFLIESMIQELSEQGFAITPDIRNKIDKHIRSPQGHELIFNLKAALDDKINIIFDSLFSNMGAHFEEMLSDKFISNIGVFSVTEDITSEQMWGLYASSGRGFALELNPYHAMFSSKKGKNKDASLFRKVYYTNDYTKDFWSNPYFLFLVKNANWAFEREWRMIKLLEECDIQDVKNNLYLDRVQVGAIKNVIFGYNVDSKDAVTFGSEIRKFDASVSLSRAVVNHKESRILLTSL